MNVSSLEFTIHYSCFSVNADGFTALDIAVLTNHVPMIKTLRRFGAEAKVLGKSSAQLLETQ